MEDQSNLMEYQSQSIKYQSNISWLTSINSIVLIANQNSIHSDWVPLVYTMKKLSEKEKDRKDGITNLHYFPKPSHQQTAFYNEVTK